MAITEEDRAKLGGLAMRAIEELEEEFGPDAKLTGAVLIYEITEPGEGEDLIHRISGNTFLGQSGAHTSGLLRLGDALYFKGWEEGDED